MPTQTATSAAKAAARPPTLHGRRPSQARQHTRGEREALAQVEAHLVAEEAQGPGAGAVFARAAVFEGGTQPSGLVVLQHPGNPHYPGDWVQYPNLNWVQPTFPASGKRHVIAQGKPLVLRFRLWLHRGGPAPDAGCGSRHSRHAGC